MKKIFTLSIVLFFILVTSLNSVAQSDKKAQKEAEKALKEKLKYFVVTSEPSEAKVELNSEPLGITPFKDSVKLNSFYNGPRFATSSYIPNHWSITVSKEGYVSKTIVITKGPFVWTSLNGVNRIIYYVVSSPEFHIKLEPIGQFLGTNPLNKSTNLTEVKTEFQDSSKIPLSTEQIAQKVLPAVVTIETSNGSGSGFFILQSGIVVTNKHVIGSSQSVSIITSKGERKQSVSIFIHPTKDLALVKVEGQDFPYIPIANAKSVNVGADVIAIGSPSGLQNTITKGIISSFRDAGVEGIHLQTDVAINSGNSGGPLLNNRGEIVGVNTWKIVGNGKEGLGFAIFCSEILDMLKEHFDFVPIYPNTEINEEKLSSESKSDKVITNIISEPNGAEIYIDEKFVGSTPSKISLSVGEHSIKVTRKGYKDWERVVLVELKSEPTFNAILEKIEP